MSQQGVMSRAPVEEWKRNLARKLLFWLGAFYVVALTFSMTPLTHQLDDIKETVIYAIGPALTIGYFVLLALGWLDPPRLGLLIPLACYYGAVTLSTLLSDDMVQWKAWVGFWKQWVLLGPFLAFLGCCTDEKWLRRTLIFFTLVALATNLAGLLHYGVASPTATDPGARRGVAHLIADHYTQYFRGDMDELRARQTQLRQAFESETDGQRREQLRQQLIQLEPYLRYAEQQKLQREETSPVASFIYGLAMTYASPEAERTMLSVILNRTFYAGYLLLMIPLALGAFFMVRSWWWRWAPLLTIVLSLICIQLTKSKVSMPAAIAEIVIILGLVLVGARLHLKNRKMWIALVATVAVLAGCLAMMTKMGDDVFRLMEPEGVETALRRYAVPLRSRSIIWQGVVDIWKDNPWFGGGPLNFDILFPLYRRPDYNLNEISHRTIFGHNFFLDLLGETGLAGFVSFMSFLGFLVWRCLVRMRRDDEDRHSILAICFLGAMVGFYANNFVSPEARWPICAGNMWAVLGVIAGFLNRPMGVSASDRPWAWWKSTRWQTRGAWALASLALLCWVWTTRYGIRYFEASQENNRGLMLLGSDGGTGPVQDLFRDINQRRNMLQSGNLPAGQRAELEAILRSQEDRYNRYRSEALNHFERCVNLDPGFTSAYYKIANLLYMGPDANPGDEDFRKALKEYQRLREYQPEYAQIRQNLGSVYWSLGERKEALVHLRRASDQSIQPDPNMRYVSSLTISKRVGLGNELGVSDLWAPRDFLARLKRHETPVARRIWETMSLETQKALEDWDGDDTPSEKLQEAVVGDLNRLLGREDAFPKDLAAKVAIPADARARLERGEGSVFERNWMVLGDAFPGEVAMEYGEEAIRRARRFFDWWYDLQKNNREISIKPEVREESWQRALETYIETARSTGRDEDLVRGLEVMREKQPDNEAVVREMVNAYIRMDHREDLERVLKSVLDRDPMRTSERSYLAQLYLQMGRVRDAMREAVILSRAAPDLPDWKFLMFSCERAAGNADAAKKWGEEYLKSGRNPMWRKIVEEALRA